MSKHRKYSQFISMGDSSDEEDSVIDYNVGERWSSFHEGKREDVENNALTFIVHAAGIYALYGPAVQKKYYDLKDTYLGMPEDEFEYKTDDEITKAVKSNIKRIDQFAGKSTSKDAKHQVYKVLEEDMLQTILADKMTQSVIVHSRRIDGEFEASTHSLNKKFLTPFFKDKDFTYDNIGNFFNNFLLVSPLRHLVSKTLPSTEDIIEFDLSEL
jgi:hypothetical protein